MTDKRWKRTERQTAALLGSRRLANNGHAQADIIAGAWAVEHKTRGTLPDWLTGALDQAVRNAPDGTRPAVILAAPVRGVGTKRVVLLELADFLTFVNRAGGDG